jgi:diacylglycerol kinase family enzyme
LDTSPALRVVVIVNAEAGARQGSAPEAVRQAIAEAFARHGIDAAIEQTAPDELLRSAERAVTRFERKEIDAIVVGGGDGTVSAVVAALLDRHLPLGILPLGTLNHFARDLGIPTSVDDAVGVIAGRRLTFVDAGEVNGRIFVNNSSIGIYPYMVIDRERRRARHKVAKWMAMLPAFFRMMRHFPRRSLRISAEGLDRPYRTPCLLVGNNEYAVELFTVRRRHRLDAGKLWFYVVKPREPIEFFFMVCRMCFGHIDQARDLDRFELSEAEISTKASRLPVALDGEVRIMHTPLHYRSRPRALRVIVP